MKIAILGATGFVGVPLCRKLKESGHSITVIVRNTASATQILGDGITIIPFRGDMSISETELDGIDCIINLAGESIGAGRWTEERKQLILGSRVVTTRRIIDAIQKMDHKPEALINASAIGYYGSRGDEKLCEHDYAGDDFLASVCRAWEAEALKTEEFGVRVALIRIGVVLGDGGALNRMITPFKLFAGGPVGSGGQWLSWIHIEDLIGIMVHAIENPLLRGPVNATAPEPLTMKDFSGEIGKALNRPSWLPVPGFILKLAMGEMSDLVLKGQRVMPCKALESGYKFKYESAEKALRDIIARD